MDELDETVLNIQQRQKRGLIMRRYKAKIERAKELSQKRMADDKKIKKRAYAQARQIVRKRVAGKRGAEYEKLGPSEKMAIDRAIDKKAAAIKKLALRLIPKVKQAEQQRLHTFMKGQAIHNFGKPEGHHTEKASPGSAVNEELNLLFAEAFNNEQDVDQTNDANDVQMKKKKDDSAKGKSKSASIKMYNKFGEAIIVSKSVFEGLTKKSERSGVDIETLAEVYSRGRDAWVDNEKISQEQYAFARVNSYINEGSAYYELDADLHGEELSEKRGLWDNIHAKRKRIKAGSGERMRKPGSKGAPTAQDFRDAQESVEIDEAEMSLYDKIQAKRAEMRKNPEPEKEPPYKRKPALTAHDRDRRRLDKEDDEAQAQIRKRLRKEDVNLNELKTSTLKSYVNKAPASSENLVKAALYQRNEKKKAALLKKSQNRETGVRNAIDRIMQREETELDEMKTVTNRSHAKMLEVKVGGKAHSYKKYGWGLHHPTYGPLKDEKFNSKAEMKAAMEKHPHYNSKLSEETELDEAVSKIDTHADMLFKKHGSNVAQNHINQHAAVYGLNKDRLTKAVAKKTNIASPNAKAKPTPVHDVDHMPGRTISAADAIKQTRDVHAAWAARRSSMKKEETQIDEISQSTAKSYVSKAFKDSDVRAEKMRAQAFGNTTMTDKEHDDAFKKQMNRGRGINLALGKLGHKPMGSVRKTGVKVMAKEDADLEESNNTPYVRPHIEKGSTKQTGWKASNKHGRVKYFGMDFKKSAEKHAGINEETELDEGIKEKIKGVIRREKAKDMPLIQNRRDYAATKAGEAYEKGDEKKGRRYMDWREKSLKKEEVELDEGAIKDAEKALSDHDKYRADYEKKYGQMSVNDARSHEIARKKLLAKKRDAQRKFHKKFDAFGEETELDEMGGDQHYSDTKGATSGGAKGTPITTKKMVKDSSKTLNQMFQRDIKKEDFEIEESSDWINNNSKWKEAVKSAHGDDVTFKTKVQPGVSGKKDTHATNSKGTVVGVYQHHNKMGRVYSEETEAVGTKVRKNMEIVDRKPKTPGVYTKQAEVKNKIIDEEGNVQNDPKKRLMGTDSLVNAYKKDTPGQGGDINESFNIAFAAGVGVSLTAADLGMKAQGGFALHPSVIAEMEARELEEDAVSAEKKPVYMPPRRKQDGSYTAAKTVLRKSGRKIIDAKEPEDVDSDEHDGK